MTISPPWPVGSSSPSGDMMATSGPAAAPTLPGLRWPGGSWFEVIWWAASVMP